MTFVAQPYEQFVDDLLTALTGGMVREEHQFIGTDETYTLAYPDIITASLKVFGQRSDAFVLFEGGIDYEYSAEDEAITWKSDGRLPDDHSFFYVNYYLREGQRRLTDRNPGSVTTTLAEAFAREFAVMHKQMEMIYRSAFVDLAAGSSLDHVAALLGLSRKDAKYASGEALFKRSTPAPADITIPAGTLVSNDAGQSFETTDKRTLRKGQLSVVSKIRAQVEGTDGRVAAGEIKNINRPIFGIDSVINEEATFFATDKETDEQLRRRIKGTLERAGKSTLNAIKYSLIEEVSEITEGNIQVVERAHVPGFVDIKLGLESAGDAKLVRKIEECIFNSRAAGVRVMHNLPTRTTSESAQRAQVQTRSVRQQTKQLPQNVLSELPAENVLPVRVHVSLRLTERNLSPSQKEEIGDKIRTSVKEYIEALPMGDDLIYNKLLGVVVQHEEVLDASLDVSVKSSKSYQSNLSTDGRKSQVDDVSVGLMEESVFIDILVYLKDGSAATQEHNTAATDAVNRALAAAQGKSELSKTELKTEIMKSVPALQLIEGDAVILNAEYEETGRLLNNTDKVALETHQVPELRDLTIQARGVLDGQV
jgi:uncharacterized phage protein gp47/JayE